jgi:multidrug resistance efflux pump
MKRVVLIAVAVTAVIAATAFFWPRNHGPTVLRLPGTVEVQEVRLGSRVGGRVEAVLVAEGDTVEPGRVLVRLETAEWAAKRDAAKAKLASAVAAREKAENGPLPEEIAEAKSQAESARARLAKAQAGFREEQRRQSASELAAALADLDAAEKEFARQKDLRATGAGSQMDYDNARTAADRAKGRVNAAKAVAEMFATGSRKEDIDEAAADVAKATSRYDLLNRGTRDEDKAAARAAVNEAKAALDEAETNLREATIVAPEKCRIEVLSVRAGSMVPAWQPVVVALRADDLWVKVFVPSTELGRLRLGQAVEVAIDSHPGKRFEGKVLYIAATSEFTPRNVQSADERKHQVFAVKVRVADPGGVFKSGMAAEVFVPLAEDK